MINGFHAVTRTARFYAAQPAAGGKTRTAFRKVGKGKGKMLDKEREQSQQRRFDERAHSFRSTVVTLNRTPEQMEKEKAVVEKYAKLRTAEAQEEHKWRTTIIRKRWEAMKDLPGPLRRKALEWDERPAPKNRFPFTDTPPVKDYDWSKSYAKKG